MNTQIEAIREKYALKIKLEELRHKNIIEEISHMGLHKVKSIER